jgi:protein-L-isoaspartate(D-aspartate) O-methyltransferase
MAGFAQARRMMVDGQVRTSDVTDHAIIAAMLDVARERFVPPDKAALAYLDLDIPVNEGTVSDTSRRLLKPMVLAKLLEAAEIGAGDAVLDVGCATGYSSALLSRLAAHVIALEEDAALARQASKALQEIGAANVTVVTGSLATGWPARSPYDVIVLQGATDIVPRILFRQLKDGGRLVGVERRGAVGKAMVYRSAAGDVSGRVIFDAMAPLLPGFAAFPTFVFSL